MTSAEFRQKLEQIKNENDKDEWLVQQVRWRTKYQDYAMIELYKRYEPIVMRFAQELSKRYNLREVPVDLIDRLWELFEDIIMRIFDPKRGSLIGNVKYYLWSYGQRYINRRVLPRYGGLSRDDEKEDDDEEVPVEYIKLNKAVDELEEPLRTIVKMYMSGYSFSEIQQEFQQKGMSADLGWITKMWKSALSKLRRKVKINRALEKMLRASREMAKAKRVLREGILDYVKMMLSPYVWDDEGNLKVEVKEFILEQLKKFNDFGDAEDIIGVYIIGSITTRQWREGTDIDVSVVLRDSFDEDKQKMLVDYFSKNINGKVVPGTKHPVNFYFTRESSWQGVVDLADGVYDVKNGQWVKESPQREPFDPEKVYRETYKVARRVFNSVNGVLMELKRDLDDLRELQEADGGGYRRLYVEKMMEVLLDAIMLKELYRTIKEKRNQDFRQDSVGNVVYKFLEKYGLLEQLSKTKEAVNRFIDNLEQIFKEELWISIGK